MANRRDIAKVISEKTGYYIQDIEEILEAESDAIRELLLSGETKVKNHKMWQIEVNERASKKAWDGLNKEYYTVPSKKVLKFKTLTYMEDIEKELNE